VFAISASISLLSPATPIAPTTAPFTRIGTPPRSTGMLTYMHERIPGVEVDDATFARMEGLSGDAAAATGIEIAAEAIQRLRRVPGVSGVHLMAPGWESIAVPAVVRAAGLGSAALG